MTSVGGITANGRLLPSEGDEDLARAASTDVEAFGQLYERHRLAVFRYLRSRTGDDDEAGDLTAVVFERALAAIPRYRPGGAGFLAWLLRIARNASIDRHRRRRMAMVSDDSAVAAPSPGPEVELLASETRATLAAAVAALPPVQREAIALRYAAGLTAREIGAVIGKSDQATQKLIGRALAAIREAYDAD
jgi:RNA polymerase sigma-70 factor (ECF subfamily)